MKFVILSDLHLGSGGTYDAFAGAEALPPLIDRLAGPGVGFILNGDTVDFLMNEDPLELTAARAAEQARAIAAAPATAVVLQALGRALAAGAEVVIRMGNHDAELALAEVQAILRGALGQPAAIAERLEFQRGEAPLLLEVNGARVLVSHGEQNDPWNRLDYGSLGGPGGPALAPEAFVYPPGSRLVKTLMNPLKRLYGMRFADLLKPDFQGAVLTCLAVDPGAVSVVFQGSTLSLLWHLFKRMSGPTTFGDDDDNNQELGLAAAIEGAGLDEDELAVLQDSLDPDAVQSFADAGVLDSARRKLGQAGLRLYAAAQRRLVGESGESYFSLEPSADEWTEARRLATKFDAQAVVLGHTHSARFGAADGLLFANTGTWIWLMQLPSPDAPASAWADFLELCRKNPRLDPAQGPAAPVLARFNFAVVEPLAAGPGARLSLCEWKDGSIVVCGQADAPGRAAAS